MKKFMVLFLVLSLFLFSENLYAKKKGAELIVQQINGQQAIGELITVKENSLLLLDSESGADVSVDIREIKLIEIVKESKVWKGIGYGLLSGVVSGALIGYLQGDDPPGGPLMAFGLSSPMPGMFTAYEKAFILGTMCGITGGVLGGIGGAIAGKDKIIQFEEKSETEIKEILQKLRKKARIRNFQ